MLHCNQGSLGLPHTPPTRSPRPQAGTVPGSGARRAALPPHRSPLLGTDVVPPLGKEGDLRPDEAPARVLLHLQHHAVEDVLRLVVVVLVEGLDPACQHTWGSLCGAQPFATSSVGQQGLG